MVLSPAFIRWRHSRWQLNDGIRQTYGKTGTVNSLTVHELACNPFISMFFFFREERVLDEVKIALVGKYTKFEDAYFSVVKALKHASLHCNRGLNVVVGFLFCFSTF